MSQRPGWADREKAWKGAGGATDAPGGSHNNEARQWGPRRLAIRVVAFITMTA